jgi:hypothetical protein
MAEKLDPGVAMGQINLGPLSVDFDGQYGLEIFAVILIVLVLAVGTRLIRRCLTVGIGSRLKAKR